MYINYRALLDGQPHALDVGDDEETLVEGWRVDPERVPHAFAHGAPVFIHGMLKPQSSFLSAEVVLESVQVWNVNEILDASPSLHSRSPHGLHQTARPPPSPGPIL